MGISNKGVDLSVFNTQADFTKAKADGVKFAIIRAGFGNTVKQEDKMFKAHMDAALRAKLPVGAYWFSYATSVMEARAEAQVFLSLMAPYKGRVTYPLYCDYEYASIEYGEKMGIKPDKALITAMIAAFCDEVRRAGWYAGYYTNLDFIRNRLDMDKLKNYDLWLADYTSGPDYDCGMQQITSSGVVDGITGNVDVDIAYKDYPTIIREKGLNGLKPEPALPVEKDELGTCTQNGAPIRSTADTAGKILGYANRGDLLSLLADDGWGWSKVCVRRSGVTGWIANSAVDGKDRSGFKTAVCDGTDVNLRKTGSLSGKIIGTLDKGEKFKVVSINPGSWIDTGKGFVYYDKTYIRIL